MSEPARKRQATKHGLLLFVGVCEDTEYVCFSTPYCPDVWTEELIQKLSMSEPSERTRVIPGCEDDEREFCPSLWTKVDPGDVALLKNVSRVVLGSNYE